jgi:hypothetical protein
MNAGVSCNVCLVVSFSSTVDIKKAEQRLRGMRPGLLKSLEKEHITLFPKVNERLNNQNLFPNAVRRFGKVIKLNNRNN